MKREKLIIKMANDLSIVEIYTLDDIPSWLQDLIERLIDSGWNKLT